jgi:hypothetical protein
MATEPNGVTRHEVPAGQWLRVGSWQVRVVENTVGGHVLQKRKAPKRSRTRDDRRGFDNLQEPTVD